MHFVNASLKVYEIKVDFIYSQIYTYVHVHMHIHMWLSQTVVSDTSGCNPNNIGIDI